MFQMTNIKAGGDLYLVNGNMMKLEDAGKAMVSERRERMKCKFWNWVYDEGGPEKRTLFLNGEISDEPGGHDDDPQSGDYRNWGFGRDEKSSQRSGSRRRSCSVPLRVCGGVVKITEMYRGCYAGSASKVA